MDQICTRRFYGNRIQKRSPNRSNVCWVKTYKVMPSHILGPTQYWREFYRQADALAVAAERSTKTDTLCTFVYQHPNDGGRRFVVAHPEVYWWHYKDKPKEQRCSYEVSMLAYNPTLYHLVLKKNTWMFFLNMEKTCFGIFWMMVPKGDNKIISSSINFFFNITRLLVFIYCT